MRTIKVLDEYCGEGGAGVGYYRAFHAAGFAVEVTGVDNSAARLERYPYRSIKTDALTYLYEHGHEYDFIHGSPTCTGYSRGTAAIPDRLQRYDRHIALFRTLVEATGKPYVIENVADARKELRDPILLCGRQFDLTAVDDDGTKLHLDRHRLFESNLPLVAPEHAKHDRSVQVAGSYGGARRDKVEARTVRKGGYVPSADVQRALLRVPWMSEKGCQLSIPPIYTEFLGAQIAREFAT